MIYELSVSPSNSYKNPSRNFGAPMKSPVFRGEMPQDFGSAQGVGARRGPCGTWLRGGVFSIVVDLINKNIHTWWSVSA